MKVRLQNCRSEAEAWGSSKSLIVMFGISISAETHGGRPTMNAGTRQILQAAEQAQKKKINSNGDRRTNIAVGESAACENDGAIARQKPRVFVVAENRVLREALSRMLVKSEEIEVVGTDIAEPFRTEDLLGEETDILLLSSRGSSRGAHKQGDCQSVLSVGANGEKPFVSNEAENRSRRSSGHRAGVPDARVHALVFSFQFSVLSS